MKALNYKTPIEKIIDYQIERLKEHKKPVHHFIWFKHGTKQVGQVTFRMKESAAIQLFERTHSRVKTYHVVGSDD